MKRFIALTLGLLLAGCSSLPEPFRDDDSGMKLARLTQKAYADPLTDEEVHQVFFATYSRSRDPMMGGEDLEMIHGNLIRLRERLGDEGFATALNREDAAVVSAVGWHLGTDAQSDRYPLTSHAFVKAPKKTFELESACAKQQGTT